MYQPDEVSEQDVLPTGDTTNAASGDATGAEATQERVVPQKDLDNLRSKYDRRIAQMERQYQELSQKEHERSLQASMSTRAQQLEASYTQSYIAQGYDEQTARSHAHYWANEDARAEIEQQQKVQTTQQELQTYKQREQEQQRQQSLLSLRDTILGQTGLTEDELVDAHDGLSASDPNFINDAWSKAIDYARQKEQRAPSRQAQQKRASIPFPTGGASRTQYQPQDIMELGKPESVQFLQQWERDRRR